jgi:hypothetical protein
MIALGPWLRAAAVRLDRVARVRALSGRERACRRFHWFWPTSTRKELQSPRHRNAPKIHQLFDSNPNRSCLPQCQWLCVLCANAIEAEAPKTEERQMIQVALYRTLLLLYPRLYNKLAPNSCTFLVQQYPLRLAKNQNQKSKIESRKKKKKIEVEIGKLVCRDSLSPKRDILRCFQTYI